MKKGIVLLLLGLVFLAASFRYQDDLFKVPEGWPKPAYNFRKHPLSAAKVALGRQLFYDPILSSDSTISCASCHAQYSAFTHIDHSLSHGIAGKIGTRNSPVLVNLAWNRSFMWDGSVNHIYEQAIHPITNPLEMAESMTNVAAKLQRLSYYSVLFRNAFEDETITAAQIQEALGQFMLTLVSANARYDSVMRGEKQFIAAEERGYTLFKKNCSSCHTEPLFTNGKFENNGLRVDDSLRDAGRMKITGNSDDSLKFKVPTLRNIEYSPPYMHDGRFKSLNQVLNNYIMGLEHTPTLSHKLAKGIYFTPDQKADLLAFLHTLSDKSFVTDPRYAYPKK